MDSGLTHTLHPGPIDNSVLTLQDHHRSSDIWNGQTFEPLTCRRCDGQFWRLGTLDPRVQRMMLRAGFYGVYKAGRMRLDHALVTALVERWRPETHTFHLPVGEATVTLQDISILWGLPVDGDPITGVDTNRSTEEWQEICHELLGFKPPPEDFDRGRLKIRCLQERFKTLPDTATEETVQFYARAYILQLLGGQLLSDMSNNKVKLMYLPLLRNFEEAGRLSWGGAVLACLYRALCRATKPETSDICGPLVLLQIWAWERIPFIRPGRLAPQPQPPPDVISGDIYLPSAPYGSRWNVGFKLESVGSHVLVVYRDQLDNMKDDQFVWEPYTTNVLAGLPEYCISGRRIWQTVSPLICFDVIEFHHPDRVLRQFGQQQSIPAACDTIPDIHLTDRRGRQNYDWAHHHREFVNMWDDRCARVVTAPFSDCSVDQSDAYMTWYRQITRLLIGNPAMRPHAEYLEAGAIETMAHSIQKIYHCATVALQEGYEITKENALREIQEICEHSLRSAHKDHRLNACLDTKALSPGTSPFVPPKAPRGRPRKRGAVSTGAAAESKKRSSYVSKLAVSAEMSRSFKSSDVLPSDTWDSLLTSEEVPDIKYPNTMLLDHEVTGTSSPIPQALAKIREICVSVLRLSNGNQTILSTNDPSQDGPKLKRCTPRRRGGMNDFSSGANPGVDSYFPLGCETPSPAPSPSIRPNGTSLPLDDNLRHEVEPLGVPAPQESPLPDLQENLHLEMIELDTITGSREPSPCVPNPSLHSDSAGLHDPLLVSSAVAFTSEEQNTCDMEVPSPAPEPVPYIDISAKTDDNISYSVQGDICHSQFSKPDTEESPDVAAKEHDAEAKLEPVSISEPENLAISEPPHQVCSEEVKSEEAELGAVEDGPRREDMEMDAESGCACKDAITGPHESSGMPCECQEAAVFRENFPMKYKRRRRSLVKHR